MKFALRYVLQATKALRRLLHQLCVSHGAPEPVLAFDRWLARSRLAVELKHAGWRADRGADAKPSPFNLTTKKHARKKKGIEEDDPDPLIPSGTEPDPGLVKDLMRGEIRTREQVERLEL